LECTRYPLLLSGFPDGEAPASQFICLPPNFRLRLTPPSPSFLFERRIRDPHLKPEENWLLWSPGKPFFSRAGSQSDRPFFFRRLCVPCPSGAPRGLICPFVHNILHRPSFFPTLQYLSHSPSLLRHPNCCEPRYVFVQPFLQPNSSKATQRPPDLVFFFSSSNPTVFRPTPPIPYRCAFPSSWCPPRHLRFLSLPVFSFPAFSLIPPRPPCFPPVHHLHFHGQAPSLIFFCQPFSVFPVLVLFESPVF